MTSGNKNFELQGLDCKKKLFRFTERPKDMYFFFLSNYPRAVGFFPTIEIFDVSELRIKGILL